MDRILSTIIVIFLEAAFIIYSSFVGLILYNWLFLPITNYPLNYIYFLGIDCFWSYFTSRYINNNLEDIDDFKKLFLYKTTHPMMFLLIGYIIKLFY
jgi:hypothetical protein